MNQQDIAKLYETMNSTTHDWGEAVLLHELISRQCANSPEKIAVVWNDQQMTYAQLEKRSDQIAHQLNAVGITSGSLVGICCERQLDMPALLLGILKAGAAYVPLDPDYPIARLIDMVEDSRVQMVLTHESKAKLVESFGVPVLYADKLPQIVSTIPYSTRLPLTRDPSQAAYVIYTSGSTGKPKGVVISHAGVVNFLLSTKRQPGFTSNDRILATTTLSFDISVMEIFLPLIAGGSIAVVDRETAKDAQRLTAAIERHQVNIVQATPARADGLLRRLRLRGVPHYLSGRHRRSDPSCLGRLPQPRRGRHRRRPGRSAQE